MIVIIIFWVSVLALVYTYLFYPALLELISSGKPPNIIICEPESIFPKVSVLMAVHNEEDVLSEKIQSVFDNKLPAGKIEMLVGSDASTDNTEKILKELSLSDSRLKYVFFKNRKGKSAIINELVRLSDADVLVITDANVMLEKDTLFHLVKHFKNKVIGLVDSNMRHKGLKHWGISVQENAYISREVRIKYYESVIWGTMMGPFGGCYAVRKELYSDVPLLFLVDDFYINMKVLLSGRKSIIEKDAFVYEDVSNSLGEEFRRKVRIAAGNFQNLNYFSSYLFSNIPGLSFCFLSHKVLRWLGPFFLAAIFATSFFLSIKHINFRYVLVGQFFILSLPIIDYFLGKIKIHVIILRFITHFISMNFALLVGFIKFLKGVKSNVWQPTRRNQ